MDALEIHIVVGTFDQILDDRAAAIRAALLRVGIPNDKIIWNRTAMGGLSGEPLKIPATKTGRFSGPEGIFFPDAPAPSHGVIFR